MHHRFCKTQVVWGEQKYFGNAATDSTFMGGMVSRAKFWIQLPLPYLIIRRARFLFLFHWIFNIQGKLKNSRNERRQIFERKYHWI